MRASETTIMPESATAVPALTFRAAEPVRARASHAPIALALALCGCALASALSWSAAAALFPKRPHTLLVLGDSMFAENRQAPGTRLQDWLSAELGPDWGVVNFADSAASVGDFYLKLGEAELLGVKPDIVVFDLSPQKLVPEFEDSPRFNEDGTNLRWLPWNREGYRFYETLDPHSKQIAVARKVGLICGFYEALRALSLRYVEWPMDRRRRAHRSRAARSAWLRDRAVDLDRRWRGANGLAAALQRGDTRQYKDFEFLITALHARRIPLVAVMPPDFHSHVLQRLSPESLRNLQAVYRATLARCKRLGVPVLDFNSAREREQLSPADWEDHVHLRPQPCLRRIAHAVHQFIETATSSRA